MTANKLRGTIEIELDRPRILNLNFNALCLAEEKCGINLASFNPTEVGLKGVRAALWAGLIADDPSLTLQKVGDLVHAKGYSYCLNKLVEALTTAFGVDDSKEAKDPNAAPEMPSPSPSPATGERPAE